MAACDPAGGSQPGVRRDLTFPGPSAAREASPPYAPDNSPGTRKEYPDVQDDTAWTYCWAAGRLLVFPGLSGSEKLLFQLLPLADAQLFEGSVDVSFDRADREEEPLGNLSVAVALHDE